MVYIVTGLEYDSNWPKHPGVLLRGLDYALIKRNLDAGRSLALVKAKDEKFIQRYASKATTLQPVPRIDKGAIRAILRSVIRYGRFLVG